jgi:cellulase/cellobiase CelA1
VAIAIVLLIVVARLSIAGSGPFPASVSAVTPTENGLVVTVTVTNEGASAGQTTCRIVDVADRGVSRSAFVLSPRIEPGQTLGFSTVVTEFGTEARELAVTCRTP